MKYYIFLRFIFLPRLQPPSVFYASPPLAKTDPFYIDKIRVSFLDYS